MSDLDLKSLRHAMGRLDEAAAAEAFFAVEAILDAPKTWRCAFNNQCFPDAACEPIVDSRCGWVAQVALRGLER
jgi:hypothetical protein